MFLNDGKTPFAPERFKNIVKERYLITKFCNTSYGDTGNITPLEKEYILGFIKEELEQKQRAQEKLAQARNNRK